MAVENTGMDEMTEADKAAFAKPETKTITDEVHGIAVDRLRSIIERIERLEEEKKALSSDIKDIMAEAKSAGFEPKALRRVLAARRMEAQEREELEGLLEVYMQALGM
jgi:uncharacterized protein (UPF0335 family)